MKGAANKNDTRRTILGTSVRDVTPEIIRIKQEEIIKYFISSLLQVKCNPRFFTLFTVCCENGQIIHRELL